MKNIINFLAFLSFSIILLFGCTTVNDTLYLREAAIVGPVMPVPIHLTDSVDTPSFTISPRFSYTTTSKFSGEIAQYTNYFLLDSLFVPSEHSLNWQVVNANVGIDMDLVLSRVIALTAGVNYSSRKNFSVWGGNFGIGFNTSNPGAAFRFDVGMQIHSVQYEAYTVVHRTETGFWGNNEETFFYHDVGKSTHFDPYFNLTFNTAYKSWPVNIFFNGGYVIQTLFSFEPKTTYSTDIFFNTYIQSDARGSSTAGFINLTPGIFFYLNDFSKILLGTSFYIEIHNDSSDPKYLVIPRLQIDFSL